MTMLIDVILLCSTNSRYKLNAYNESVEVSILRKVHGNIDKTLISTITSRKKFMKTNNSKQIFKLTKLKYFFYLLVQISFWSMYFKSLFIFNSCTFKCPILILQ